MNDKYCPCGHEWIHLPDNLLMSELYYCKKCDKMYQPTVKELTKEWFKENFHSDRFTEIKELAMFLEAKEKVTKKDLVKLGYLDK